MAKRLEESALKELNVVALLGFILYVGLFLGCNLLMLPVNQDKTVQHINLLLLWFNLFTLLSSNDAGRWVMLPEILTQLVYTLVFDL